jgi:olefin beta-lactone synthetase
MTAPRYQNIAQALSARAQADPARIAMHFPIKVEGSAENPTIRYQDMSFAALESRSNAIARGLQRYGIGKNTRTVVMVRPSPEFFLLIFALFKLGAVPVLVDPGIAKSALKACLANAQPQAFIGIPLAHAARIVLGWGKNSITQLITVGRRWFWGGASLAEIEKLGTDIGSTESVLAPTDADDLAAILFTSGSTGVPKGVEYRHRHFVAQVELLRTAFQIQPGTVNMPTFPPFALFDPALGCTSVIPVMDPTRPARADPRKLICAIRQFHVGSMFGSPALLNTLASYCQRHQVQLPSLHTVMSAGAPVPPSLVELARAMLSPEAHIFTPYGATEALPVAIIEGTELLGEIRAQSEAGAGICVGEVLAANCVRIIKITDAAIAEWSEVQLCAIGEIGEITVRGPSVTERYFQAPEKTLLAKIAEDGAIVHRMGDVGFLDASGKLWYCGRKSQRVQTREGTLFTEQVEAIFNSCPLIKRSALVGLGSAPQQRAAIVFEYAAGSSPSQTISALQTIAAQHPMTSRIEIFLCYEQSFPVDIRHNAKIGREQLAQWAARSVAGGK